MIGKKISLGIIFVFLFAASVSWGDSKFCMQSHSLQGSPENHKKIINLMKDAGVSMIRDEMYWSNVEKEKGKLEIPQAWDENVKYTLDNNIDILLILNYSNKHYDQGMAPVSDEAISGFTNYCKFILEHFKGK